MKKLIFRVLVVLSSAVVLMVFVFTTKGMEELKYLLGTIEYYWIAVAFGCMGVYWLTDGIILHQFTSTLFAQHKLIESVKVSMVGQFFGAITPFASGGQPAQAFVMIKYGIRAGHAVSILIIKTILYQGTLLLYSLFMAVKQYEFFTAAIPGFFYLYIMALVTGSLIVFLYILSFVRKDAAVKIISIFFDFASKFKPGKKLLKARRRIEMELDRFDQAAAILKENKDAIIRAWILQIIQLTFYFLIPYFIFLSIGRGQASAFNMMAAQALMSVISTLIPSPGSIGGAEGVGYMFFGLFFQRDVIIPVVLIWRIITYYSGVVLGGLVSTLAPGKSLKTAEAK